VRNDFNVEVEALLGILPVAKPLGITSHDVVHKIRKKFGIKRVGHAGTLDPLATGVLVVAVGPATRFLQYLPLEPKVYVAEIQFGSSTETFDREGAETGSGQPPADLIGALEEIRSNFEGLIQQIPPMYSAVKIDGKALYKYAREGRTMAPEARTVHISELSFEELSESKVSARIVCSGGPYIRTLANELGEALGCGAHLAGLVRTSVGKFELGLCKSPDEILAADLIPLADALPPMPLIQLNSEATRHLREGRSVKIECSPSDSMVGLIEPSGNVFSVARLLGNVLQPECVIPENAIYDSV
jgi:tRNA pseudouridine55 synthase